jgi:hypothetical protein
LSGSRAITARICTGASPTFTTSPISMFIRFSAASSTTAPHTPSRLASASVSEPPPFSSSLP